MSMELLWNVCSLFSLKRVCHWSSCSSPTHQPCSKQNWCDTIAKSLLTALPLFTRVSQSKHAGVVDQPPGKCRWTLNGSSCCATAVTLKTAGDSAGKSQGGFGLPVLSTGGFTARRKLCVGVSSAQLCSSVPERFSDTRGDVWVGCKLISLHGLSSYHVFEVGVFPHSEEMVTANVQRWRWCFNVSLDLENPSLSTFPKSEGGICRLTSGDRCTPDCLGKNLKGVEPSLKCLLFHQ